MRGLMQVACVLAVAIGAGLMAFGSRLQPSGLSDPLAAMQSLSDYKAVEVRMISSVACGFGTGLVVLGGFGLLMPLAKRFAALDLGRIEEHASGTLATLGIWISAAAALIFGVLRQPCESVGAMYAMVSLAAVVCAAAAYATSVVCRYTPWARLDGE